MKAETIKIKDFKVLHDFEADLQGKNIILLGDNGVGKSSFIQFIEICLGKKNIPTNINGEGEVVFSKEGKPLKFALKIKDGKPIISVDGPGVSIRDKKSAIAEMVGALDFDIDEFVELSKTTAGQKKQVEIFKSFLPKEVIAELNELELKIKKAYDERTAINRMVKEKESIVNNHPLINHVFEKIEKVDIDSVFAELQTIQAKNNKITEFKNTVDNIKKDLASNYKKIEELQNTIDALKATNELLSDKEIKGDKWLNANQIQDVSELNEKIKNATNENNRFNDHARLKVDYDLLQKMKSESEDMTVLIETSKQCISDTIKQMDSPIEGLTFEDEVLVYNGIPVSPDSLSTSEIMELGIRLKMAENPDLGILFIQRGESLGADRLKLIKEIADKSGWQIIMEQVQRGTKELHVEIMAD
jgi:DNA repair ATPase RecN